MRLLFLFCIIFPSFGNASSCKDLLLVQEQFLVEGRLITEPLRSLEMNFSSSLAGDHLLNLKRARFTGKIGVVYADKMTQDYVEGLLLLPSALGHKISGTLFHFMEGEYVLEVTRFIPTEYGDGSELAQTGGAQVIQFKERR